MKWLIDDLYEIIEFDPEYVDFFDLYYVLKRPARVIFFYGDEKHTIESLIEDGVCVVRFDDKWYRDRDEFFKKARLDERKLTTIHRNLSGRFLRRHFALCAARQEYRGVLALLICDILGSAPSVFSLITFIGGDPSASFGVMHGVVFGAVGGIITVAVAFALSFLATKEKKTSGDKAAA